MKDGELAMALVCENCPEPECPYNEDPNKCPTLLSVKHDKRLQKIILKLFQGEFHPLDE